MFVTCTQSRLVPTTTLPAVKPANGTSATDEPDGSGTDSSCESSSAEAVSAQSATDSEESASNASLDSVAALEAALRQQTSRESLVVTSAYLHTLVLSGCHALTNPSIGHPLREELELHSCCELRAGTLARCGGDCGLLRELNLSSYAKPTTLSFEWPSLRTLTLDGCVLLEDARLDTPRLTTLSLRGCTSLDEAASARDAAARLLVGKRAAGATRSIKPVPRLTQCP